MDSSATSAASAVRAKLLADYKKEMRLSFLKTNALTMGIAVALFIGLAIASYLSFSNGLIGTGVTFALLDLIVTSGFTAFLVFEWSIIIKVMKAFELGMTKKE